MVKLKSLSFHNVENVPDHLLAEMEECARKLGNAMFEVLHDVEPNISMAAVNWVHAAFLNKVISDAPGELEKAGKMAALMLIKNIGMLIDLKEKEKSEDEKSSH